MVRQDVLSGVYPTFQRRDAVDDVVGDRPLRRGHASQGVTARGASWLRAHGDRPTSGYFHFISTPRGYPYQTDQDISFVSSRVVGHLNRKLQLDLSTSHALLTSSFR